MDVPVLKPPYTTECRVSQANYVFGRDFVDCELGDNGISLWCDPASDELVAAATKGLQQTAGSSGASGLAHPYAISNSGAGDTGVTGI